MSPRHACPICPSCGSKKFLPPSGDRSTVVCTGCGRRIKLVNI